MKRKRGQKLGEVGVRERQLFRLEKAKMAHHLVTPVAVAKPNHHQSCRWVMMILRLRPWRQHLSGAKMVTSLPLVRSLPLGPKVLLEKLAQKRPRNRKESLNPKSLGVVHAHPRLFLLW